MNLKAVLRDFRFLRLFTIYRIFPGNPVGKWLEHEVLCLPNGKFPGATEHLKRWSYFSGWNIPNGNSWSIFSKPSLIPVFRPSLSFFGKWNWFVQIVKAISGRNLPVLNFANHLPTPWTEWFARANGKQPKFSTVAYLNLQKKLRIFRFQKYFDWMSSSKCPASSSRTINVSVEKNASKLKP